MKMCRWSNAATSLMCSDSSIPLPNTSPDMSPMPTTVKSSASTSMPSVRKWNFTDSQAPRAVMPIPLWSYPSEPPEAKASPSQKPRAFAISFAVSEKVAVPLSAATTR
ncbi:MAG: hypothetical protein ABSE73_10030 [Planctomycetota bacterium]